MPFCFNLFNILQANCLSVPPSSSQVNEVVKRGGEERVADCTAKPMEKVRVIHSIIISHRLYEGVPDLASPL